MSRIKLSRLITHCASPKITSVKFFQHQIIHKGYAILHCSMLLAMFVIGWCKLLKKKKKEREETLRTLHNGIR